MSQCFSFICHKCRCELWVGQATGQNPDGFYLYADGDFDHTRAFLADHLDHPIQFNGDSSDAEYDHPLVELLAKPGLPPDLDHCWQDHITPEERAAALARYERCRVSGGDGPIEVAEVSAESDYNPGPGEMSRAMHDYLTAQGHGRYIATRYIDGGPFTAVDATDHDPLRAGGGYYDQAVSKGPQDAE